ncbi:MAG: ParB family transcriptional regulator, chromosome partitioning protein [Rhodospirillaceae bacterium]|nr:ParB family transcriptional regulator, chromosome partitioning protein [Rhodospirillaceae bacterium]
MSGESKRAAPRGLGRGLSALLGDGPKPAAAPALASARGPRHLPIGQLEPSPLQPRRHFDETEMQALAESIRTNGILQPILVRRHPSKADVHEIVAGERRWRAAQLAELHEVPVVERELSDRDVLELALVENVQRHDLSALEEAEGYHRLIEEFGRSQEDLARQVGKSRAHVANTLRLLRLPDAVKTLLLDGRLSAGHARALLPASNAVALAERVVAQGLSVRQTEALVAGGSTGSRAQKTTASEPAAAKDADTRAVERDLARALGLQVDIAHGAAGGSLTIRYRTLEQLDEVIRRLNRDG